MAITTPFTAIEDAIEEIREGRMIIVVDDADRENEGDLVIAAQFATPETINFMATHGRGLICLCLTEERADQLELRPMTERNEAPLGTAFTVSVEAREGVTTGISAADRSHTIQVAIAPGAKPSDLVQPGHVFPLRAKPGGVLERIGQTEAAVDLARLAGLNPSGVVCEIMNDDGTMARVPDLVPYCERHELKMITVADLVEYRRRTEKLVERGASVRLPTPYGEFTTIAFRELLTGKVHVALVRGAVDGAEDVLVRVHSECLTGDVFHSFLCDCGEQLDQALAQIAREERGVLLYMAQEGRGIGLLNKLKAYELQAKGLDTVEANLQLGFPADARDYGIGNQILADLGLTTIRILTNNPKKLTGIDGFGLAVVEQVPIEVVPNDENRRYLAAKRDKLGHKLHHQDVRNPDWSAKNETAMGVSEQGGPEQPPQENTEKEAEQ
jgi:3,4-dihydroxy 2-butanone 4-phosphate synthase / GTP cyclohydrolase II